MTIISRQLFVVVGVDLETAIIGQNGTGRPNGDGTYRQYLGLLCFTRHPLQRLSEVPDWARETVRYLLAKNYLRRDENGDLPLTDSVLQVLVINDRAGLYDL